MAHAHFSKSERSEISILLKKGHSRREIAQALGKDHSSVVREIRRNSIRGIYDPRKADHKAYVRRKYAKYQNMKINESPVFLQYLEEKLKESWAPEQIAGRWKCDYPHQPHYSFKAISKYLYSSCGQRLCKYLPSQHYSSRRNRGKKQDRVLIKHRVSIDLRPNVITLRKRLGDFEGDVLGAIKTDTERLVALVERKSRKLFARKVRRLKYAVDGFNHLLKPYRDILHSVTLDNGVENIRHEELHTKTYFANPYHSWEKGQIENTLGRLRRFVKKKSSLKHYTNRDIQTFVHRMNNTPRKCLHWKTPHEVFNELSLKARQQKKR